MDGLLINIAAAHKAMDDVVIPAMLGASNAQGLEQATLVRDLLSYLELRLPLVEARRAFEANDALELADVLLADPNASELATAETLRNAREQLAGALEPIGPAAADVLSLISDVAVAVRAMQAEADQANVRQRSSVETIVVKQAHARNVMERAWAVPLGFDPFPAQVRGIRSVLLSNSAG